MPLHSPVRHGASLATGPQPPPPRAGSEPLPFDVPSGLVVHPSMAGPARPVIARPDDGVGTWRPVLRESGPLPARMGPTKLATWIHSTSRNLSPASRPQQAAASVTRGLTPGSN